MLSFDNFDETNEKSFLLAEIAKKISFFAVKNCWFFDLSKLFVIKLAAFSDGLQHFVSKISLLW